VKNILWCLMATACMIAAAASPATAVTAPHTVSSEILPNAADGTSLTIACPPGEYVSTGGYSLTADPDQRVQLINVAVIASHPGPDARSWIIGVRALQHPRADPAHVRLYAVCAPPATVG
jgi:hypothetical protein